MVDGRCGCADRCQNGKDQRQHVGRLNRSPSFSPQRSSAGFPPAWIDMGAAKGVHDGRTEITDDEPPRSPNEKGDQEKSEPKRDAPPYTWHRPIAAKSEDREEQGDDCTQCSEKHRILPPPISAALILGDDSAMVAGCVGETYDTTTRSASCYIQTATLPNPAPIAGRDLLGLSSRQ